MPALQERIGWPTSLGYSLASALPPKKIQQFLQPRSSMARGQLVLSPPPQLTLPPVKPIPSFLPTRPLLSQPAPITHNRLPKSLWKADLVYIRRGGAAPPLSPPYSGPFPVLQRSPKSFTVDLGDRTDVVSVDRLKPHVGPSPVMPATAPRRGRSPSSVP